MFASSRRTPSPAWATVRIFLTRLERVSEVDGNRHYVARSGGVGRGRFVCPATHDYHLQAVAGECDGSHGTAAVHGPRGNDTSGFGVDTDANAVLRQTGSEAECDARADLPTILRLADEEDLRCDLSAHLGEGGNFRVNVRAVERRVLHGIDDRCAERNCLAHRVFEVRAQEGNANIVGDLPTRGDQLAGDGVEGLGFGCFTKYEN